MALYPVDPGQLGYLKTRLQNSTPEELLVLRTVLRSQAASLVPPLWSVVESKDSSDAAVLSAAGALAAFEPEASRWREIGGRVAKALVTIDGDSRESWLEVFRNIRSILTPALSAIFRETSEKPDVQSQHEMATSILCDYAHDDPAVLAELLLGADPLAYTSLFRQAEQQSQKIQPILRAELDRKAEARNDAVVDPAWAKPATQLVSRIGAAAGLLDDRFAFCQTMKLNEFLETAEGLRASGYRPVRVRPYNDLSMVRVAAVWARDGREWRLDADLSSEDVLRHDEKNRGEKYVPVDVACYVATAGAGIASERYAIVWALTSGSDDVSISFGATAEERAAKEGELKDLELNPRSLQAMRCADGCVKYCGVWGRESGGSTPSETTVNVFEPDLAAMRTARGDQVVSDATVSGVGQPQSTRARVQAALRAAEKTLETKPGNLDARRALAMANLRAGEPGKALEDLKYLIGTNKNDVEALRWRAIALARLGRKSEALADLAGFRSAYAPLSWKLGLAVVVAAELGEGLEEAIGELDRALSKEPKDSELRYESIRAFALASAPVMGRAHVQGRGLVDRACRLIEEAVRDRDVEFSRMDVDPALDPIRDDAAFTSLMSASVVDRRYAVVWSSALEWEEQVLEGLDPAEQLRRGRKLTSEGYRPVAWSVAPTTPGRSLAAISVWHRARVSDAEKQAVAERQARAAVTMVKLNLTDSVWPLFGHSPDPRVRSMIVDMLSSFGCAPNLVASEFERFDSHFKETPARAGPAEHETSRRPSGNTEQILFHPAISTRRALILALGTFGVDTLPAEPRERIIRTLLQLFRNDPDAGIHGACEWTLRQWNQTDKLNGITRDLSGNDVARNRRWFVNKEGQTFTRIEGPVEFRMGSPDGELDRNADLELPRRMLIPRSFAIATKEVTVEEFGRFVKSNNQFSLRRSTLLQYSPDPNGPCIASDWFTAAAYCNWLSEQERLPKDQWCYLPNELGAYAEGMSIPADVLERTGYRLPTEAEWEFACRAGAVTSRHYGSSIALLEKYAMYQRNGEGHAWLCGKRRPNDLGLFDVLGNVYEWCHGRSLPSERGKRGPFSDIVTVFEVVDGNSLRGQRGGAFSDPPDTIRAAIRIGELPSYRGVYSGIRPVKTWK